MSPHESGRARVLVSAGATLLIAAASVHAQGKFPPESLKNLQAMPELRERYYGDDAYDFGDVVLTEIANTAQESGDMPGALTLLELNVELLLNSWFGLWMLAEMRAEAGQTEAAIGALERAVALKPRPDLVERLEALRRRAASPQAPPKPNP